MNRIQDPQQTPKPQIDSKKTLFSFIRAFLFPTLIGKCLVLYFGLNYSESPGDGYGYGLILAILFTCTMLGLFVKKFWDYEDI